MRGKRPDEEPGSSNVIALDTFRTSLPSATHNLFYLTEDSRWLGTLQSFPFLKIHALHSELEMKCRLVAQIPDIVLIESSVRWHCPLELIEMAHRRFDVPVVLICSSSDLRKRRGFLKEAFLRGLTDKITTPMSRDELWETLDVLLRFRRHAAR